MECCESLRKGIEGVINVWSIYIDFETLAVTSLAFFEMLNYV
jgi:hypothetical protein